MTYPVPRSPVPPKLTDNERALALETREDLYRAFVLLASVRGILKIGFESIYADAPPFVTSFQRESAKDLRNFSYALKQWLDGSPECEFDRFLSLYLSDDLP